MTDKKFSENTPPEPRWHKTSEVGSFTTFDPKVVEFNTSTVSSNIFEEAAKVARATMEQKSTLSRRRALGDSANSYSVDTPGFWLHVQTDSAGVPKEARALEVNEDAQSWRWCNEEEWRIIDRLPRVGIYVFLY